ncbi:MAG: DnaJ domain-containing protein [Desulfobulbaceae bacterium]|nr:DnaJ domain-containing protein [Desulfobulbaceae bacterium]
MTKKDWQKIEAARELLALGEKATLAEIKDAYRRMSKKYHPDLAKKNRVSENRIHMHEVTEAYRILIRYCRNYRFPLVKQDDEQLEPEDWWFDRFGQDPLWGKKQEE